MNEKDLAILLTVCSHLESQIIRDPGVPLTYRTNLAAAFTILKREYARNGLRLVK